MIANEWITNSQFHNQFKMTPEAPKIWPNIYSKVYQIEKKRF